MEKEQKNQNNSNTFLLVVIFVLMFVVGFLAGQLINKEKDLKDEPTNGKIVETEELKEPEKEEPKKEEEKVPEKDSGKESEKEPEKESGKTESKEEHYCVICDSDGGVCCGTGSEAPSIFKIETDQKTVTSDEAELSNNGNKYKVKFTRKNNTERVIVDGKTIYEKDYIAIDEFFMHLLY